MWLVKYSPYAYVVRVKHIYDDFCEDFYQQSVCSGYCSAAGMILTLLLLQGGNVRSAPPGQGRGNTASAA